MYCFHFTVTGYCDTPGTAAEPAHGTCGQALIDALQPGLSAAGFKCSTIEFENTGWQFYADKNGTTYLIGGQISGRTGPRKAQVYVSHRRGLVDRLLIRNKPAPQNYVEKFLRDTLKALPGVSDLEESESFGEIEADNDTFIAIRQ